MTHRIITEEEYVQAASILQQGGLVAFPTESWYGLAADPWNREALERLYVVKQRPAEKPILVLIGEQKELVSLIREIPSSYRSLMDTFWPGPLTLVFPANELLPAILTANTGSIAVRCTSHPIARNLIRQFAHPITGTSANISGSRPLNSGHDVVEILGEKVDLVLDGGLTRGEKGSTIVGCNQHELCCIREGQIPFAVIQQRNG